ncbi:ferric reductase like transmembrane component [Xylariaceae sp. FL0804]|nr:ferric reductase like transmembrane component [Xylariaceae sp. FL0804]
MAWPYQFLELNDAEKHVRRQSLDRHALYAQLSALLPVAVFLALRLGTWLLKKWPSPQQQRGAYSAVPDSPMLKEQRLSPAGSWESRARRAAWWLGDDVVLFGRAWGQRDEMIAGVAWTVWLLFLCVVGTGHDYLHLTKRLGGVAVSQFPVQYLLSLKSLNPFALAFKSSHEQINRWHRVLGRIIYFLLILHGCFYLNFYVQQGLLSEKVVQLVPALGIIAFTGMHILNTTALSVVRQYSYRVFFISHLLIALALPPIIYFHADHAAFYVAEALVVFIVDIAKRKYDTIVAETVFEIVPGTDLVKISASMPPQKTTRFRDSPGGHVYLSLPPGSRVDKLPISPAHLVFDFVFSPFTVASTDDVSGNLTLVARLRNGPMTTALAQFAKSPDVKIPIAVDGPYGCANHFPNLAGSEFDRILLVAGGVGATFILPIYNWIANESPAARAQMIWAVRGAGDATWPVPVGGKSILEDDNIHLYLTGDLFESGSSGAGPSRGSEGIEMQSVFKGPSRNRSTAQARRRPDLQKIVDDVFRLGSEDRVAVLVCGPEDMARELRSHVAAWVKRGRRVWFHNESFSW